MVSNVIALIPHFDEVVLTDSGKLAARVSVPQANDGFSLYMHGRLAEDVPLYVQRIDAHCAVSQHLAAVSALDRCYSVTPPEKAMSIRRALAYVGAYFHQLEQLFLSRPSGDANIVGLVATDDVIGASDIFEALRRAQQVVTILGGRAITPERGIPGGVTKGTTYDDLQLMKELAVKLLSFALRVEEAFRGSGAAWVMEQDLTVPAYSLATVSDTGEASLYDGALRIVDPKGAEIANGDASKILPMIQAWKEDLPLRVGPLARLNVGSGASTPQAKALQKHLINAFGEVPIHRVAAGHWAMVVELVEAAELLASALTELESGDSGISSSLGEPSEGIAAIEGASGTLIHRYVIDEKGIVQEAQVVSPGSLRGAEVNAALSVVVGDGTSGVTEGLIEQIVSVIGSYQPAYVPNAAFPLRVTLRDKDGKVAKEWRRP